MFEIETTADITADQKICCAFFDPAKWQNTRHDWFEKAFIKDSVPEVFHIPLPGTYKKTISRMWKKAAAAGVLAEV